MKQQLKPSTHLLLIAAMLAGSLAANAGGHIESIKFTPSEQAYIAANPSLRLCIDPNWLPYEGLTDEGKYVGLIPEYMREIEARTGILFDVVRTSSWQETWKLATEGGCDVISGLNQTQDREPYIAFTEGYITEPSVLVTQAGRMDISRVEDLKGKRLAVVAGYALDERIGLDFPTVQRVYVKDLTEGLAKVNASEVDALADSEFLIKTLLRDMNYDLRVVNETRYLNVIRVGVRRDAYRAYTIMNKAVKSLSYDDKNAIRASYAERMASGQL